MRRALRRASDAATLNIDEISILLSARGEALTQLCEAAARVRDAGLLEIGRPGVMQVSLDKSKPVGFGVLMCDNLKQAVERSNVGLGIGNKGEEAALAVLALWNLAK